MNRTLPALLATLLLAAPAPALAQTLIQGATVHTGDGQTLLHTDVLISADGTLQTLSPTPLTPPPGAAVIDARGLTLTPGLIDPHTQLGLVDVWAVKESVDTGAEKTLLRPALRAADDFNPRSVALPLTRSGGVTTVAVAPTTGLVAGQIALVQLRADDPNAWARVAPEPVGLTITLGEPGTQRADGDRAELILRLRELFEDARFLLKNPRALDDNRARPLAASRLDLLALQPVLDGRLPLFVHAHRAADIEAALRFAAEQRLRLVIVGGAEAWLVAPALAKARVPVILHPLDNLPASFAQLGTREDNPALLRAAGVPIAFSTAEAHNVRNLRFAAGNAVRAGLPWQEALRAVTSAPAALLGLTDQGVIAPGKRANLALWTADPLDFSARIHSLFIDGKAVSTRSRQDGLYERYALPVQPPPQDATP